ncbi:unnamed protein product [Cuscuta campestris]|uniref:CCHC-type domain-containing protein n=1 Tax=Cuscuta campestris TaxID=132261 RepID=A0A484NTB3_9ASTE|nr:unnamed protein product [Cuscuta campestris]
MNDSSDDDEVKLVMKRFCKFLRKKEKVEDGPVCYGCGEAGHIKNKCPRNGRNTRHFKRKRAYISWGGDSGDESTDQDEDEVANLCLMAHKDQTDDVQESLKTLGVRPNQKPSHPVFGFKKPAFGFRLSGLVFGIRTNQVVFSIL